MKNKSLLRNKFWRIFEVAPAVCREHSPKFGLKRGLFFVFLGSETELLGLLSALAAVCLLLLSLFWMTQIGGKINFDSIVINTASISKEKLILYDFQLNVAFSIISIYLIGHFAMWMGYSLILFQENKLFALILIIIGALSTVTDFAEYSIRIAIIELIKNNVLDNYGLFGFWLIVRQLSIWFIFLGSVIISVTLFNKAFGKFIFLLALIGLITIPFMYIMGLSKIWYIWLIIWHFAASIILWKTKIFNSDFKLRSQQI